MRKTLCSVALVASLLAPVTLSGQPNATFVILLHGSLRGNVVDRMTGKAVSNAQITLVSTSLQGRSTHTGRFNINTVPAGTYQIRVTGKGYFSLRTQVRIEPDKNNAIEFRLLKLKDANEPRRAALPRTTDVRVRS